MLLKMSSNIFVFSIFTGFLCVLILARNVPGLDSNQNVGEGKNIEPLSTVNKSLGLPDSPSLTPVTIAETNNTKTESTGGSFLYRFEKNGAMLRAFYVVVGVTAIVIVYFVVRAVRLRRKRSKTRKYGIIAKSGDVEMTPLEQDDDDDDDMTVFEIPSNHLLRK